MKTFPTSQWLVHSIFTSFRGLCSWDASISPSRLAQNAATSNWTSSFSSPHPCGRKHCGIHYSTCLCGQSNQVGNWAGSLGGPEISVYSRWKSSDCKVPSTPVGTFLQDVQDFPFNLGYHLNSDVSWVISVVLWKPFLSDRSCFFSVWLAASSATRVIVLHCALFSLSSQRLTCSAWVSACHVSHFLIAFYKLFF